MWKTEAIAADRAARAASSHAAVAQGAEAVQAREWKAQLDAARRAEAQSMASETRAEQSARRARQELTRAMKDSEDNLANAERRAQANEAQVLGQAWQISGELRSELDAFRYADSRPPAGAPAGSGGQ